MSETTNASETPETDAFTSIPRGLGTGYYQAVEKMKKIEKERNASQAREDELAKALEEIASPDEPIDDPRETARKALEAHRAGKEGR